MESDWNSLCTVSAYVLLGPMPPMTSISAPAAETKGTTQWPKRASRPELEVSTADQATEEVPGSTAGA